MKAEKDCVLENRFFRRSHQNSRALDREGMARRGGIDLGGCFGEIVCGAWCGR